MLQLITHIAVPFKDEAQDGFFIENNNARVDMMRESDGLLIYFSVVR